MNTLKLNAHLLGWGDRKHVRNFIRAKGGHATVKQVRAWVSPGPVGVCLHAAFATIFAAFLGLFVFLPFLFVAAVAPFAVPLATMSSRKKWLQLLPPERDNDLVELVEGGAS